MTADDEFRLEFSNVERRRGVLVDMVQVATYTHDLTYGQYCRGLAPLEAVLEAARELDDMRFLLRAHDETHPPKR